MRSNSLDIKLKKTEKELKQHEQEIADQLELHELTVKELDLTKASLTIAQEEIKQYKQKVAINEDNNQGVYRLPEGEKRACTSHRPTVYGKIQTWKWDVLYLATHILYTCSPYITAGAHRRCNVKHSSFSPRLNFACLQSCMPSSSFWGVYSIHVVCP